MVTIFGRGVEYWTGAAPCPGVRAEVSIQGEKTCCVCRAGSNEHLHATPTAYRGETLEDRGEAPLTPNFEPVPLYDRRATARSPQRHRRRRWGLTVQQYRLGVVRRSSESGTASLTRPRAQSGEDLTRWGRIRSRRETGVTRTRGDVLSESDARLSSFESLHGIYDCSGCHRTVPTPILSDS